MIENVQVVQVVDQLRSIKSAQFDINANSSLISLNISFMRSSFIYSLNSLPLRAHCTFQLHVGRKIELREFN